MNSTLRVGNQLVVIDDVNQEVRTTIGNGDVVVARPVVGSQHKERAQRLGYRGTLWGMCKDHDLLHCVVAQLFTQPESHALRRAYNGQGIDDIAGAEEDAVMALQRLWNLYRERSDAPLCIQILNANRY